MPACDFPVGYHRPFPTQAADQSNRPYADLSQAQHTLVTMGLLELLLLGAWYMRAKY